MLYSRRAAYVLCWALVAASANVGAADREGRFAFEGAGLGTCQQFISNRDKNSTDFFLYAGWIDGYVTGLNRFMPETYDLAPWQTTEVLVAMVASYCSQNPEANFAGAVERLGAHLKTERLVRREELIQVSYQDRTVLIYPSVLDRVKKALLSQGLLKGPLGKGFDEPTALALMEFQRRHKLEVNGLPTHVSLTRLFASDGKE